MPLKREDGPESGSSDAFSPEQRKALGKSRNALESESKDEILKALNMVDDLGSRVEFFLNKLNTLDNIEMRLQNLNQSVANMEESFAIIENDVEVLKEKTEKTNQKVKDLEESVDYHDQDIGDLQRDVKGLRHGVDNIKMQLLFQGHYCKFLLYSDLEEVLFKARKLLKEKTYSVLLR